MKNNIEAKKALIFHQKGILALHEQNIANLLVKKLQLETSQDTILWHGIKKKTSEMKLTCLQGRYTVLPDMSNNY